MAPAEPLDSDTRAALRRKVSLEAVERRKELLIRSGGRLDLEWPNPKDNLPIVLCRLRLSAAGDEEMRHIRSALSFDGEGPFFGKSWLSRIWRQFGPQVEDYFARQDPPVDFRAELEGAMGRYRRFLGTNTENAAAMNRTAGYVFGESFPDSPFDSPACDLTGRELSSLCLEYVRRYGRTLFEVGMNEYLSPTYHGYSTAPFLNVAEFAESSEARSMARAALDYLLADYALNCHHGILLAPIQRAKGLFTTNRYVRERARRTNTYQMSHAVDVAQWTGWLYWGGGNTPEDETSFDDPMYAIRGVTGTTGMVHAVSELVPPRIIRNIGAKRVRTPYMVWQSRGSWKHIDETQINACGHSRPSDRAAEQARNPRYNMRSVYVAREYALGALYRYEYIRDPYVRHALPFQCVWRSQNPLNWLLVAHPYWFTARERDGSVGELLGSYDWAGASPFGQMVHWENAAVLVYDIPDRDPYCDEDINAYGGDDEPSVRTERPIQAVYAYFPTTVDQAVLTESGLFLKEGRVFVALRPFGGEAHVEAGGHEGWSRLALSGGLVGLAVEVGDSREYGSFRSFQRRVAATRLDLSELVSERRVAYRSTRGHSLRIRHTFRDGGPRGCRCSPEGCGGGSLGWLPEAEVNCVPLDFDRWPACLSPYVRCEDRVLDVNDGRRGFTIDWRGDLPVYRHYRLRRGRKVPISAETEG